MPGPRPKPTAQRRLEGNPSRRPLNDREPVLPASRAVLDDPRELAGDPVALTEWRRLTPMLRTARQITDGDRAMLVLFCQEWSRAQRTQERLIANGDVVAHPTTKQPMRNPFALAHRHAVEECRRLAAELGLSPSSRSKVTRDGEGPLFADDDFAEFDDALPLDAEGEDDDAPRPH